MQRTTFAILFAPALALAACGDTTGERAVSGGAIGAGAGAAGSAITGGSAAGGALLGGAAGAAAGALTTDDDDDEVVRRREYDDRDRRERDLDAPYDDRYDRRYYE
jgi:hypothetical protein